MYRISLIVLICLTWNIVTASPIMIDRGVRLHGLWCFPALHDSTQYYYLPNQARLAVDEAGKPAFSLVRYVGSETTSTNQNHSIQQASGGGLLHMLIEYHTPAELVQQVEADLQKQLNNRNVKLAGPIVFREGSYGLVSSLLQGENTMMIAQGQAPVLEGSRLALSFALTPEQTILLQQSLQMTTSDLSVVFEMEFEGITPGYNATLTVDWDKINQQERAEAEAKLFWVGGSVKQHIDQLIEQQAITLNTVGNDDQMDQLMTRVYETVVEMLFKPVTPEVEKPETSELSGLLSSLKNEISSGFSLFGKYERIEQQRQGKAILSLNKQQAVSRQHLITFNLGSFYQERGDDPQHFQDVSLEDPAFQQRTVTVNVDGSLVPAFNTLVNSVTITLEKIHQSGDTTLREVTISRKSQESVPMVYSFQQDHDRQQWLEYRYKTAWQFQGYPGVHQTEWVVQTAPEITVYAPYQSRSVMIEGSAEELQKADVRAIVVETNHQFFNQKKQQRLIIYPREAEVQENINLLMSLNQPEYQYTITWIMSNGEQLQQTGKDHLGLLFVDQLPEPIAKAQ
ncbi:MAG: hypothetical protein AAGE93_21830 [Bacteroidota bacterium]